MLYIDILRNLSFATFSVCKKEDLTITIIEYISRSEKFVAFTLRMYLYRQH